MDQPRKFGRFRNEQEAREEAARGGFFWRPEPGDDMDAIIPGFVAGAHQSQKTYDERHGIVRDSRGRVVSRRPLDEVNREPGPRQTVSEYETAGFVAWQVSKRASRARVLVREVGELEQAALRWAAGTNSDDLVQIRRCAEHARGSGQVAIEAWEEAYVVQAGAHRDDESAYERVLKLHGVATEAADEVQAALNEMRATLERIQRSAGG